MVVGQNIRSFGMAGIVSLFATMMIWVLGFGFFDVGELVNFLFFAPAVGVLLFSDMLLPYRSMLFPAGRTEKYFAALVLAVIVTVLGGLSVLAMGGVSILL